MDVDRLIFGLVIISAFEFLFLLLPVLIHTLWRTWDMRGLGRAILIKLIVGDLWMISFLAYLMANRLWQLGGINDVYLIALALILVSRPLTFYVWYRRWVHAIRQEGN